MTTSLLLDEMFSGAIAGRLRAKGYDVLSVVTDQDLAGAPDDQVLARAASGGRALVTANIKDFLPLDSENRATGRTQAGLILVSAKTFPHTRSHSPAVADALLAVLESESRMTEGQVIFLARA